MIVCFWNKKETAHNYRLFPFSQNPPLRRPIIIARSVSYWLRYWPMNSVNQNIDAQLTLPNKWLGAPVPSYLELDYSIFYSFKYILSSYIIFLFWLNKLLNEEMLGTRIQSKTALHWWPRVKAIKSSHFEHTLADIVA